MAVSTPKSLKSLNLNSNYSSVITQLTPEEYYSLSKSPQRQKSFVKNTVLVANQLLNSIEKDIKESKDAVLTKDNYIEILEQENSQLKVQILEYKVSIYLNIIIIIIYDVIIPLVTIKRIKFTSFWKESRNYRINITISNWNGWINKGLLLFLLLFW